MRSPLTRARPDAARKAASVAAASGSRSNTRARRARRSTRSGSSSSEAGEQRRRRLGGEVVEAAERVDDVVAVQRPRERVHGDVARPEVRLQAEGARLRVRRAAGRPPRRAATSMCRSPITTRQRAEDVRRRVHAAAEAVGERARERLRAAVDGDVDVADAAPQQLVAQAAADEPAGLAGAERGERRAR